MSNLVNVIYLYSKCVLRLINQMNLRKFNGQFVRITDVYGNNYDGLCIYNNPDYNEHEFGRRESSLEIASCLFYNSEIKEITSLEDHDGPYGHFLDPFGKLEEDALKDNFFEDILLSENDEHVSRMIRCLEYHFDKHDESVISIKDEIIDALNELLDYPVGDDVKKEATKLIEKINKND